jgi:hypothetical protein
LAIAGLEAADHRLALRGSRVLGLAYFRSITPSTSVIPANAGIQMTSPFGQTWMLAVAGMTKLEGYWQVDRKRSNVTVQ